MQELNNLLLSKIIHNVSKFDIYNLCLINRRFYEKIWENSVLWTALIRSEFGWEIENNMHSIRYYYDNKRAAYGIISNESLLLCLINDRKSIDKLTYLYSGIKYVSIGSQIVGFVTANDNLVICGTFYYWGKASLELEKPKFITYDVKKIVCMSDTVAFLTKDRNVYIYRPDDVVYPILTNVTSIEPTHYKWGFNAIADDGFYSSIDFDIFSDDNKVIQTDNITISSTKYNDMYNIILLVNDIEQPILFLTDNYCLAADGILYKIIHEYDDTEEIYNYSIKKLAENVLFAAHHNRNDYWIDKNYRLIRKDQYDAEKIIYDFDTPIISLSSNGDCLFILANNGYLYTIGIFPGSYTDSRNIIDSPKVSLTDVHSYNHGFKAFICLIDN